MEHYREVSGKPLRGTTTCVRFAASLPLRGCRSSRTRMRKMHEADEERETLTYFAPSLAHTYQPLDRRLLLIWLGSCRSTGDANRWLLLWRILHARCVRRECFASFSSLFPLLTSQPNVRMIFWAKKYLRSSSACFGQKCVFWRRRLFSLV